MAVLVGAGAATDDATDDAGADEDETTLMTGAADDDAVEATGAALDVVGALDTAAACPELGVTQSARKAGGLT